MPQPPRRPHLPYLKFLSVTDDSSQLVTERLSHPLPSPHLVNMQNVSSGHWHPCFRAFFMWVPISRPPAPTWSCLSPDGISPLFPSACTTYRGLGTRVPSVLSTYRAAPPTSGLLALWSAYPRRQGATSSPAPSAPECCLSFCRSGMLPCKGASVHFL